MKNNYVNKILPLTLKELKSAEIELKSRKNKVYDSASYEVIECVARVVKISGMDVKISDESDVMEFVLFKDPLRDAVTLIIGGYYRFEFMAKKNILKGSNVDGFGYEINNIKRVSGNQLIAHLANCLSEKLGRERFKESMKMDQENQQHYGGSNYNYNNNSTNYSNANNPSTSANYSSSIATTTNNSNSTNTNNLQQQQQQHHLANSKYLEIEQSITKYCRELNTEFDKEMIYNYFETKYEYREIERVLEILSDKGEIMDLGLVYEWVGGGEN